MLWRITPADAGKTPSADNNNVATKDHPRGCGENFSSSCFFKLVQGSPPRMRGKLRFSPSADNNNGITPADAGKTLYVGCNSRRKPDHPRGCGENGYVPKRRQWGIGSPPRMRGKLRFSRTAETLTRITPADAGKTLIE